MKRSNAPIFWTLFGAGGMLAALGMFVGLGLPYVWYLDKQVRTEFAQLQWQVPTRVYARPLQLKSGIRLNPEAFELELAASGYHKDGVGKLPGIPVDRDQCEQDIPVGRVAPGGGGQRAERPRRVTGGVQRNAIHVSKARRGGIQLHGALECGECRGQIAAPDQRQAGGVMQVGVVGQPEQRRAQDGAGSRLVAPRPGRISEVGPGWREAGIELRGYAVGRLGFRIPAQRLFQVAPVQLRLGTIGVHRQCGAEVVDGAGHHRSLGRRHQVR